MIASMKINADNILGSPRVAEWLLLGLTLLALALRLVAFVDDFGFDEIFSLTIATEGWLYRRVNVIWRVVMIPVSFMIFMPQLSYNMLGIVILASFVVYERLRGKTDERG